VQDLPAEIKEAQQKRLEELKLQSDSHARAELERKMALRYRRVKFFGESTMRTCSIQFIRACHGFRLLHASSLIVV